MTQALYCRTKRPRNYKHITIKAVLVCRNEKREITGGPLYTNTLVACLTLGVWHIANIWHMTEIAAFIVKSASSANTGLACYGYIQQSTMIDKLSLRLGGGRVLC